MAEAAGILRWMIAGCLDWQTNGLVRPRSVKRETDAYFADQDLVGQWVEECCDTGLGLDWSTVWDRSADLFESWSDFCHKAGEPAGNRKTFGQALQRRGFEPFKQTGGVRAFRGIRVRAGAGSE